MCIRDRPKEFAEECSEIIREMDPTARTMRVITTLSLIHIFLTAIFCAETERVPPSRRQERIYRVFIFYCILV